MKQFSIKCQKYSVIALFSAPLSQPIGFKLKPPATWSLAFSCASSSLFTLFWHRILIGSWWYFPRYDWLLWLLWFWFYDTRSKSAQEEWIVKSRNNTSLRKPPFLLKLHNNVKVLIFVVSSSCYETPPACKILYPSTQLAAFLSLASVIIM